MTELPGAHSLKLGTQNTKQSVLRKRAGGGRILPALSGRSLVLSRQHCSQITAGTLGVLATATVRAHLRTTREAGIHCSHIPIFPVSSVLRFQVTSKVRMEPGTGNKLSSLVPSTASYLARMDKCIQEPQGYPTQLLQDGQSTMQTRIPGFILNFGVLQPSMSYCWALMCWFLTLFLKWKA